MKRLLVILSLSSFICAMDELVILQKINNRFNPLMAAAYNNELDTLRMLLSETVDPDTQNEETGFTALHLAVLKSHEEAVTLLLACDFHEDLTHGADSNKPNKKGLTPLMAASYTGNTGIASVLLNYGARVEAHTGQPHELTALHLAASRNHPEMVELLLNVGANKDPQDSEGKTPLMVAAQKGHTKIIHLLCTAEASRKVTDKEGLTALHHACLYAEDERALVMLLLDFDSITGVQDDEGATALHYAAGTNKLQVVASIAKSYYPINATNIHQQTALFIACANGHLEVAKALLDVNADHTIADKGNNTPYAIALKNNHTHVAKEFKNRNLN